MGVTGKAVKRWREILLHWLHHLHPPATNLHCPDTQRLSQNPGTLSPGEEKEAYQGTGLCGVPAKRQCQKSLSFL